MLHQLDLNLLKAFYVLGQEKSVSRAAQRLYISQPAMSKTLARLRETFDDELFLRTPHGIVPTLKASELLPQVEQVILAIENLYQGSEFIPEQAQLTVTIASTDYACQAVVLPLIAHLAQVAPGIRVCQMNIGSLDSTQLALEQGKIDFALETELYQGTDVYMRKLYQEKYVVAMGKEHPLAGKELGLTEFSEAKHALVSYHGGSFTGIVDEALSSLGYQRQVQVSLHSFMALRELLVHSDYLAVVPWRLVNNDPRLYTCEAPLAVPGFTKTLIWHARTHNHPVYVWLREQIYQCSQEAYGKL
ncbi:hypothetical protein CJP74_07535 [Psittacicella melopsittaci]|uniref:HTH lysR-type domain-containing protein n=1 Tax=Psittacicella melopsittaci TaxID=2028576 RepID=A0A3A1XZF5_9GAMM|nr:LysR family transcriptional regulator [Psittacicella melopsittaci]RIY31373.1 hypothetical protein CJP74_07535 [Psittacicella melopsittaci]